MKDVVIGVDLGGTKMMAAVADRDGRLLSQVQTETLPELGSESGLERMALLIERAATQAGIDPRRALGIGIGSPGPLDLERGLILFTPNLRWHNFSIRDRLADRMGLPVALINDCKAGGLGELRYGAGQGYSSMVYLGVGTGIGGCVIIDGKIFSGATGNAGEIGHLVIDMEGPVCGCGSEGCLEAISSGTGISRAGQAAAAVPSGARLRELAGGNPSRVDGGTVAKAAAEGDSIAVSIMVRAAKGLGTAVSSLMNCLGPAVIVLGGGVIAKNGAPFLAQVEQEARRRVLPGCGCPIVQASLGEDSVVRGAVALALDAFSQ